MICNLGCTICNFPERMLVCHRHPPGPTSYINSTYFHRFPSFPPSSSSLKTDFPPHHSTFLISSADCHRNRAGKHAFSIGSIAAHRETKDSWKPTSRKLSWPTVDVVCRVLTPVSLLSKIRWGVLQLLTGSCRCHLPRSSNSRPISPSLVNILESTSRTSQPLPTVPCAVVNSWFPWSLILISEESARIVLARSVDSEHGFLSFGVFLGHSNIGANDLNCLPPPRVPVVATSIPIVTCGVEEC